MPSKVIRITTTTPREEVPDIHTLVASSKGSPPDRGVLLGLMEERVTSLVDREKIKKLFLLDGLIMRIVYDYADSSRFFYFTGEKDTVKELETWAQDVNLKRVLEDIVKDVFIFGAGNAFVNLGYSEDGRDVPALMLINPDTGIDFIRNQKKEVICLEDGSIEGFVQKKLSFGKDEMYFRRDKITRGGSTLWTPKHKLDDGRDRIAHFKLFSMGDEFLGVTPLQSIYKQALIKLNIEDNSVSGDTEILLEINGVPRVLRIADLFKEYPGGELSGEKIFSYSFSPLKGTVLRDRVLKVICHRTSKPLYRMILSDGTSLDLTDDHVLFLRESKVKRGRIFLKEIREGSVIDSLGKFVATPAKFPRMEGGLPLKKIEVSHLWDDSYLKKLFNDFHEDLETYVSEHYLSPTSSILREWRKERKVPFEVLKRFEIGLKDTTEMIAKTRSFRIPVSFLKSSGFALLCGLWLGDGSYAENSVLISAFNEEDVKKNLERICSELGIPSPKLMRDKVTGMINSSILRDVMTSLGFIGDSASKKIPDWLLSMDEDFIATLLRGYFSTDGCICVRSKRKRSNLDIAISASTVSKELACGIKRLLLRCGVLSSIKEPRRVLRKKNPLTGQNLDKLYRIVIPAQSDNIRRFITRVGFLGEKQIKALEALRELNKIKSRNSTIFIEKDIAWVKVKDVVPLDSGALKEVYDLQTEETNKFLANGIFVHNCGEGAFRSGGLAAYVGDPTKPAENVPDATLEKVVRELNEVGHSTILAFRRNVTLDRLPAPDLSEKAELIYLFADLVACGLGVNLSKLLEPIGSRRVAGTQELRDIDFEMRKMALFDRLAEEVREKFILRLFKARKGITRLSEVPEIHFLTRSPALERETSRAIATLARRGQITRDPELEKFIRNRYGLPTQFVQRELDMWMEDEKRIPQPQKEVDVQ